MRMILCFFFIHSRPVTIKGTITKENMIAWGMLFKSTKIICSAIYIFPETRK